MPGRSGSRSLDFHDRNSPTLRSTAGFSPSQPYSSSLGSLLWRIFRTHAYMSTKKTTKVAAAPINGTISMMCGVMKGGVVITWLPFKRADHRAELSKLLICCSSVSRQISGISWGMRCQRIPYAGDRDQWRRLSKATMTPVSAA